MHGCRVVEAGNLGQFLRQTSTADRQRKGGALEPLRSWWPTDYKSITPKAIYHTVASLVSLTPEESCLWYLGVFLGKMQELRNEIRQRVKQPARRWGYIENDRNLQFAKGFAPRQWLDRVPNPPENDLRARLLRHLDKVLAEYFIYSLTMVLCSMTLKCPNIKRKQNKTGRI